MDTFSLNAGYWLKKKEIPKKLLEIITTNPNKHLLDLGCGGGRLAGALVGDFDEVYGIDVSKELISQAAEEYSQVTFICGDFQRPENWKIPKVDLIVSNCAIRKDYCSDLQAVADICYEKLNDGGEIALRIQAVGDLDQILPRSYREATFYSLAEVEKAFGKFDLSIEPDCYKQRFSHSSYLNDFLRKININPEVKLNVNSLNLRRQYYIVKGAKSLQGSKLG